jgi:Fe-S cluster biogenesis protein NfuA
VLPVKVVLAGVRGHKVAATYAVFGGGYKSDGWRACRHVGVTRDLEEALRRHEEENGDDGDDGNGAVSFVRALSFAIPNDGAMESVAADWRGEALRAGGRTNFDPVLAAMEQDFDADDDDDDDDDEDAYFEMMAGAMSASRDSLASARGIEQEPERTKGGSTSGVSSPFVQTMAYATTTTTAVEGQSTPLDFTKENVDRVLEEVRPYLISDGGNVSVERVDEQTRNVYLKLEGACGSCPSSTVTMQMGIERVLKENFRDLGDVIRVEGQEQGGGAATELTYQAVEQEVNRVRPAIIAMGGHVEIVRVDPIDGSVELKFRGSKKVQQGLELALLDVDFVKRVDFVSME